MSVKALLRRAFNRFSVLFLLFQRADDLIALSIFPGKALMLQDEI
jgi:hypothetical protein